MFKYVNEISEFESSERNYFKVIIKTDNGGISGYTVIFNGDLSGRFESDSVYENPDDVFGDVADTAVKYFSSEMSDEIYYDVKEVVKNAFETEKNKNFKKDVVFLLIITYNDEAGIYDVRSTN